jgi:hypothetical protein
MVEAEFLERCRGRCGDQVANEAEFQHWFVERHAEQATCEYEVAGLMDSKTLLASRSNVPGVHGELLDSRVRS